jgi:hypothetical protein
LTATIVITVPIPEVAQAPSPSQELEVRLVDQLEQVMSAHLRSPLPQVLLMNLKSDPAMQQPREPLH